MTVALRSSLIMSIVDLTARRKHFSGSVGGQCLLVDDNNSAASNFYYVTAVNTLGESSRCDQVLPQLRIRRD